MRASFVAAALLAACARAIQITAPTKGQVIDLSEGFKVTWTTVSTDPTSAHLFLVNQAGGHTPYSKDLGEVDLTKGGFTVTLDGVPDDTDYQFNIQSVTALNTGILAQSQQFEVKSSGKKSTTSSASAVASTSASTSASAASESSAASSAGSADSKTTLVPSTTKPATASGTTKVSSSASVSQTAAAPANRAVHGSSLLALVVGLVAVIA